MKTPFLYLALLLFAALSLAGCELAAGIFKAGVWVGVLLVVGGIVWMISRSGA